MDTIKEIKLLQKLQYVGIIGASVFLTVLFEATYRLGIIEGEIHQIRKDDKLPE